MNNDFERALKHRYKSLTTHSRKKIYVEERFMIALYLREYLMYKHTDIVRVMGRTDHTTSIHAVKTMKDLVDTYSDIKERYFDLVREITMLTNTLHDINKKY